AFFKKFIRKLHNIIKFDIKIIYIYGAKFLIHTLYKIDYKDFDKCNSHEGAKLIICNHISYMDGLIINAAIKADVRYIIDKTIYNMPIINYFMKLNNAIPIAPTKKDVTLALEEISKGLRNGDTICIFPEGRLTYTGNLGRFKPGIEWIINRDPVPVYPLALQGLWGSIFSRKYRKSRFKIIPRKFRPHIKCICGDMIEAEDAKINNLQTKVLQLKNSITD
ncbi:MAG: 1-acyl-sn-glycerol-3-phosphate acyltransferase, partial [Pseudomonadota bacterium]